MDFDYTVTSIKSFKNAVEKVVQETINAGFRVLYIHDVTKTLAEKKFQMEPFKIIEICNAKNAYNALQADIKIGLFLPCKINFYQKDGETYISGLRRIILPQFFPKTDLVNLAAQDDKIIRDIIDRS